MVRVAGRAWAIAGCGIGGGFFLGTLLGGGVSFEIEDISTLLEMASGGVLLSAGAVSIAYLLGKRVRVPAAARWGLAAVTIAGGLLVGLTGAPMVAEEGPDDLSLFLEPGRGLTGLALVACALMAAALLSFLRFPRNADAPPEPSLEEMVYGRRR
jgi:hypothetical protein